MALSIREAETFDIPEIRRIASNSWKEAYSHIIPAEDIDQLMDNWYSEEQLKEDLEKKNTIFLVAANPNENGIIHAEHHGKEAKIKRLYIDPEYWNQGIGTRLLDSLEEKLLSHGVRKIILGAFAENEVGNSFYESRGFKVDEIRDIEILGKTYLEKVYTKTI